MNEIKLGKLEKIKDLRSIWKNEEYDFTPWLAKEQNIKLLSDELGISIKVLKTEASVGKYSLDILAVNEDTNENIIIENQLEITNHDHLGKVLVYGAGYDAKTIIWIVKDLIKFFTTKLIITNKRVNGKTGLINTNELDSPLNKINGVQVRQGLFGKIFNYGTVSITTASTVFNFDYIDKPNEFKTILNNQIEKYDDDRIEKQAKKMAEAMK